MLVILGGGFTAYHFLFQRGAMSTLFSGQSQAQNSNPVSIPSDVPIRIEILNGCGTPGVARRAQVYLRNLGYDVLSIGDAQEHFVNTIVIERRDPANANAEKLAKTLSLDHQYVTRYLDTLSHVWVTLIIGDDYRGYLPDSVETIQ